MKTSEEGAVVAASAEPATAETMSSRAVGVRVVQPLLMLGAVLAVVTTAAVTLSDLTPGLLLDPGLAVRVLGPAVSGVGDLAGAVTVGSLVLATVAIPARSPAFALALRIAVAASTVWTLSSLAGLVTAYAIASGAAPDSQGFGAGLQLFATSFDAGRYLVASIVGAALTAVLAAAATGASGAAYACVISLAALVPAALSGHAGSAADHETAVSSLGLHLVGLSVWVGGLITLILVLRRLDSDLAAVTARYSGLALAAAGLVTLSGVVNASTRIETIDQLATGYGGLVVTKAVLTLALLVAGALHRGWTLRRLTDGRPAAFTRLVVAEAVVMAAAIGVAVGLSTTTPPVSDTEAPVGRSAAEVVVGYPVPPPPDLARYLTSWQPDLFWLVLVAAGLAGYVAGIRRLRRRGDTWPAWRAVMFAIGGVLLVWATSGGPAVYGRWSFSHHMVQHMLIAMIIPMLLVTGAPLLLALRTLRPREDGSRGAREWLLAVVHSPVSRLMTHPVVAAGLFVVGMVAFYYSPAFSLALRTHLGHELMIVHFLATGYLFDWVLMGADPGPRRVAHPFRLLILLATMAFHAFFGVALLQGTRLLAPEYWIVVAEGRPWGLAPLADQQYGAAIAWGFGEIPTLLLAIAIAIWWARDDAREGRRKDRAADRDGDADLVAYNAMLAGLARRD